MSVAQWNPARVVRSAGRAGTPVARALIYLIQLYRHMVSPLRPASCRFVPTCSQYAVEALAEYGVLRGGWLAVARLAKCGPWHRGGWDPIPERHECRTNFDTAAGDAPAQQGESGSFV
ncbi:membrane protein insertion efficiency factor YidD [Mycobacterium asiaticum]|uniref:membrane protein insertion efficiency factor YidD n=1 Tax=Mycobacterium asiaticum TaxID=1790 RepID=UPI0018C877AD